MEQEQDVTAAIIERALTQDNSEFIFIVSWEHRKQVRQYLKAMKQIIRMFSERIKFVEDKYLSSIITDDQDINLLAVYAQLIHIRDFYERERDLAKDMLSEYRAYVFPGHILNTILGIPRPDYECVDYRKLPLF